MLQRLLRGRYCEEKVIRLPKADQSADACHVVLADPCGPWVC